jgi:FkbM family methyltransferase
LTDWKFIVEKWVLRKHRGKDFEPEVRSFLKRQRGEVFIDIGANVGLYSLIASRRFRRVYAFEPNPKTRPVLEETIRKLDRRNVTVYPVALSNFKGETMLYLGPHEGFSGSADTILPVFQYAPNATPEGGLDHTFIGKEAVKVQVSTYDSIIKEKVDLVKVDVEGAEFLVLEGMKESMAAGRVRALIIELHSRKNRELLERILSSYDQSWLDEDHLLAVTRLRS